MQKPVQRATWNSVRDLWETDQTVLLSEHSAAYSETLPPSGMTRNGVLFERPKSERPTNGPGCLSLPTPRASEGEKGGPNQKGSSGDLMLSSASTRLLPTPTTIDGKPVDVANQVATRNSLMLQSITALLGMPEETWERTDLAGNKGRQTGEGARRRAKKMLPTPNASLGDNGGSQDPAKRRAGGHSVSLQDVAEHVDFGDYAPAIRRWEQITGHPAPPPTEPTGRGGAHRLSAKFAEWMMGLPPGWVTDIPISRTEQLRILGNGVVPRQATAALTEMRAVFESRAAQSA